MGDSIMISRNYDVLPPRVWKSWTDPEEIIQWWGPATFTTISCDMDFKVGGTYLICMTSSQGKEYRVAGTYEEIVPNVRIVCTYHFADTDGKLVPASEYGLADDYPEKMKLEIRFQDYGEEQTKMTLKLTGMPDGELKELTTLGWSESFVKLRNILHTYPPQGPRHRK